MCSHAIPVRLCSALLVIAAGSSPSLSQGRVTEFIENVTVIDGSGRGPIRDAAVVVEDGRIRAVGPRSGISFPQGAKRINGNGGYLLPGFVEMHAHTTLGPVGLDRNASPPTLRSLPDSFVTRRTLAMLLASGITTARDPGGEATRTVAIRDSIARGLLLGPRLFVSGEVVDAVALGGVSKAVTTPEEMRREVQRQAAIGVDMIKLYAFLKPPLFAAGIEEAHRLGLPAIAHSMATTWTQAARAGLDGIVHVIGWSPELLPEAARGDYQKSMVGSQFLYRWMELVDLNSKEMEEAITAVAQRHMHLDPTLVVFERAIRGDEPTVTQNPALAAASPLLVENWRTAFSFSLGWSKDDFARAKASWPKALQLTKKLFDRGVLITAGTDANNPWVVPGESYHRELELLVDAGIAPIDVISIATRNGAQALGVLNETGTIEAGKRADLVLLRSNPLTSIHATRDVVWVTRQGQRFRPDSVLKAAGIPSISRGGR